jgi:tRNA A37 threonylcarbamoyladenosine modification protein TsaB
MSYALLVDTSIQGVGVGIGNFADSEKLFTRCIPDNKSSASLPLLVDEVLSDFSIKKADLSALVVAVGPGSFTGIKIGLAFCYGLIKARSNPIQTLGLSSLREYALELYRQEKHELAVLAPLTQDFGFAVDVNAKGEVTTVALDLNKDLSILLPARAMYGTRPWPKMQQFLQQKQQVCREREIEDVCKTSLAGMWRQACLQWPAGFTKDELPMPNYLRKTTAEERLDFLSQDKGKI